MSRRAWTCAEVARLKTWRREGVSVAECAERLRRTKSAVDCMIRKSGVVIRRGWTSEEDRRLRALWTAGLRLDEVAVDLGRGENAVRCRLYTLRLGRAGSLVPEAH